MGQTIEVQVEQVGPATSKGTQQPASPAKSGVTATPSIGTVVAAMVLDSPAGRAPVATGGDTAPARWHRG